MNKKYKQAFGVVMGSLISASAIAVPIDLSSWSERDWGYSGGQEAGSWNVDLNNAGVLQAVNSNPSAFMNNKNITSYSMQGQWQVGTSGDDFMGFIFGYQNSSNFYLFDWKQLNQSYKGVASQGMTVRKMTGSTGNYLNDLTLYDFWDNTGNHTYMEILATNHDTGKGWKDYVLYDFNLDFNNTLGEFTINIMEGSNVLWDVTIQDSTFTDGQFGFYNFSQKNVWYSGFE